MLKWNLLAVAAATTLLAGYAAPVIAADVSIEYQGDFDNLIAPGVAEFEQETGKTVDAIKLPGADAYSPRITLDLSSGTAADLVMVDSYAVAQFAGSGYLAPLDDILAKWDEGKNFYKGALDVVSYNGKIYALPTATDVRMLWYNKPDFAKAGLPVPWQPKSWDDIISAGEALNKAGIPDAFLLEAGTKWGEGTTMQGFYMSLLGADKPDGDRNRLRDRANDKWIGDSPAIRAVLKFYQDVYINKKISTPAINYVADAFNDTNKAFIDGKIAIYASGNWANTCLWGCSNADQPSAADKDKLVGWTPWPTSGAAGTDPNFNISGGWTVALNAKAANNPDAIKLLETIMGIKNLGAATVKRQEMTVRSDIVAMPDYQANTFLAAVTPMVGHTTGRDTVPGYDKVSALVQDMTTGILDGKSIDDVIKTYHDALVDEFGADKVETLN